MAEFLEVDGGVIKVDWRGMKESMGKEFLTSIQIGVAAWVREAKMIPIEGLLSSSRWG